ncbi:MAG: 3-oxoacyl-[acyl-carrier-protein] reductase [Candidatus Cloacimonadia bacterium]
MENFSEKTAIVTGSAQGIGKAIANEFVRRGANIVVVDLDQEKIDDAVAEIKTINRNVFGVRCDVTQESQVEELVKQAKEQFQTIDILVNNAGITRDKLLMRMSLADWEAVLRVNLTGTFLCTQKVSKVMMRQRKGKILNIASVIGIIGNAGQSNYAAAKAGIIAFTKSVAKELASRNINVNAIAPGFIKTAMTDMLSQEVVDEYLAKIPLKRFGTPDDVAKLACFLCSEEANYITGQTIVIDGGMI